MRVHLIEVFTTIDDQPNIAKFKIKRMEKGEFVMMVKNETKGATGRYSSACYLMVHVTK